MYINAYCDEQTCYITDDYVTYTGIRFKSFGSAQIANTEASYTFTQSIDFTIPECNRGITSSNTTKGKK